jgi:hypothetical protein
MGYFIGCNRLLRKQYTIGWRFGASSVALAATCIARRPSGIPNFIGSDEPNAHAHASYGTPDDGDNDGNGGAANSDHDGNSRLHKWEPPRSKCRVRALTPIEFFS